MGRFVVSEGIAPSEWMTAHPGLPTLWTDDETNNEVVMTKGTIISVVADANGDSRVVPANGTGSAFVWDDTSIYNVDTGATPASNSGVNQTDTVTVPSKSVPVGALQFNAFRPYDKGTDIAASWITTGYVEWPMVEGLNSTLVPGDTVHADAYGRPIKHTLGTDDYLTVGKVIAVEKFATNFDDGLLSYMQLPSDPGALRLVFEQTRPGPYQGKLGIRKNLDVVNAVGAFRCVLTLA
jgi:hypothetical protein